MRITALIKMLEEKYSAHGDLEIVISSDGEGNNYAPMGGYDVGVWNEEDAEFSEPDQDEEESPINALVLYPD